MTETDSLSGWADLAYSSRHMVFEHCAEAIALLDPFADRFGDLNIAACKLLGYPRQELLTLPVSKLFGHQLADLIVFTQAVMDKGHGWSDDLSCNCKTGERIELEISATTLQVKGSPQLILVLREASRQKYQQDQALTERTMRGGLIEWRNILNLFQESERDNQLLLSSVGDGIYAIDSDGLATFVNPAGARMQFERVGEERTRKVDVRIIAATNRDLRQEVGARHFREDLYFRLNVFPIQSPALRDRPMDIAPLAAHFLKQTAKRLNMPGRRLRNSDIERLQRYSWPGNIRELQNVIERALITSSGADLNLDLPDEPKTVVPAATASEERILTDAQLRELERNNMHAALKACGGKLFGKGGAAELLGLKPTTLASRLKRLDIDVE